MPELKARAHDLNQLADGAALPVRQAPAGARREARGPARPPKRAAFCALAHEALAALADWDHDALDAAVREVAEDDGVKLGKLAQPLRAALTGKTTSPGNF